MKSLNITLSTYKTLQNTSFRHYKGIMGNRLPHGSKASHKLCCLIILVFFFVVLASFLSIYNSYRRKVLDLFNAPTLIKKAQ